MSKPLAGMNDIALMCFWHACFSDTGQASASIDLLSTDKLEIDVVCDMNCERIKKEVLKQLTKPNSPHPSKICK